MSVKYIRYVIALIITQLRLAPDKNRKTQAAATDGEKGMAACTAANTRLENTIMVFTPYLSIIFPHTGLKSRLPMDKDMVR